MESETPPPVVPSCEADDLEVSSRRVSPSPAGPKGSRMSPQSPPCPAFEKGHQTSPAPPGVWSEELKDLLGRASISKDHRALMGTVIERISSAESGLHEAVGSLLTGFEVRKMMYLLLGNVAENKNFPTVSPRSIYEFTKQRVKGEMHLHTTL